MVTKLLERRYSAQLSPKKADLTPAIQTVEAATSPQNKQHLHHSEKARPAQEPEIFSTDVRYPSTRLEGLHCHCR